MWSAAIVLVITVLASQAPTSIVEDRIEFLVEQLGDADPRVRGAAALELLRIDDPAAVMPLSGALSDAGERAVPHILRALEQFEDSRKIPALIDLNRRFRYTYWDETTAQVTAVGAAAVAPLFELAEEACHGTLGRSMNEWAAHAIAGIGEPAFAALVDALRSSSECRRLAAVKGLAAYALQDWDQMEPVSDLLSVAAREDGQEMVREAAAWALEDIHDYLERVDGGDYDSEEISDESAIHELVRTLEDSEASSFDKIAVLDELPNAPSATLTPQLVRSLTDADPAVRVAAVEALGGVNGRPTHHNDERERDPEGSIPALTRALADSSADVRRSAAQAIGRIAVPSLETTHAAAIALVALLEDPSDGVAAAAAEALGP